MNNAPVFSSKNKLKRKTISSQVWKYVNPHPVKEFSLQYLLDNSTEDERNVLNDCLVWNESFEDMYFTQTSIAERLGYSRGFVNRSIKLFVGMGLLAKNYRHKTSCQYKVSNWFRDTKVRSALSCVLSVFTLFPFPLRPNKILEPLNLELLQVVQKVRWNGTITQQKDIFKYNNQVDIPYKETSDYIYRLARNVMKITKDSPHLDSHAALYRIPESLRNVPVLNLTKWGQIKLSCFPDKAIEYAYKQVQYAKYMPDKFRWFFKLCRDWCDDNSIKPNWQRSEMLARYHNMPENARMVLDAKVGEVDEKTIPTVGELLGATRPAKGRVMRPTFSELYRKQHEVLTEDEMRLAHLTDQEIDKKIEDLMKIPNIGITSARGWLAAVKNAKEKMAMQSQQNGSIFD